MCRRFELVAESDPCRNLIVLVKGSERYVFIWADEQREEMLDAIEHLAANPELSFTRDDASAVSRGILGLTT